jgi:hypothetical protein
MAPTLTVRLTPRAQQALRRLARQQNTTEAEAAATVLDRLGVADAGDGATQHPGPAFDEPVRPGSALDLAMKAGLVGTFDGPADLASNPKYLEGLGE